MPPDARTTRPGTRGAPYATPAPAGAPAPGVRDAPTAALWLTLALMLALRAACTSLGGTYAWALGTARFLHPALAWGPWLVAAALLVPALARPLTRLATRVGEALGSRRAWAVLAALAITLALLQRLPDRVRFVGDFLLRQGTVDVAERPDLLFPQALPLDVWLHVTLPTLLQGVGLPDANTASRLIGAVEAALLVLLALRFARVLALRGVAALVAVAVLVFGGYLALYTGYSKAFGELVLLVAWAGVSALDVVRHGRGLLALGVAVAIAAALHRSGLGLVPMAVVVWTLWIRAHGVTALRQPRALIAMAIPLASLVIMVPRILAIVRRWDAMHFNPREVQQRGGALAAALADHRGADLLNLLVMFSPLVLTLLTVRPFSGRGARVEAGTQPPAGRSGKAARAAATAAATAPGEWWVLVALALPFVAVMPFIHPAQGMFRDWDDFATAGIALSLLVAWTLARMLDQTPSSAWLGLAIVASCAVPTVQWLGVHADLERGLTRVRAFVVEPPRRTDEERGKTWDYLGIRRLNLGMDALTARDDAVSKRQLALAADAFAHAADTAPSPRILQQWALAATMMGDLETAQDVYHRMLARDPGNAMGWLGLATASFNKKDFVESRRAAERLLQLQPGNPDATRLIHDLDLVESGQATVP